MDRNTMMTVLEELKLRNKFLRDFSNDLVTRNYDRGGKSWADCTLEEKRAHFIYWIIASQVGSDHVRKQPAFTEFKKLIT